MKSLLSELMEKIRNLEEELEHELSHRKEAFPFTRKGKKIHFESPLLKEHADLKTGLLHYLWETNLATYITAPVIYAIIGPIALCDLFFTFYQWVCFPAYGIPRVNRGAYIMIDRHNLAYLNLIEKLNCIYCGYANGVIAYIQEIASRTEQYWCPIKHARKVVAAHKRYAHFLEFGDAEGYRNGLEKIRNAIRSSDEEFG